MENIQLKVLHIGAKNYPPNHGGTERLVYNLVTGMPEIESHVFVDWEHNHDYPRVIKLPKGIINRWKTIRKYVHKNDIGIIHLHNSKNIPLAFLLKLSGFKCVLTVHGCVWRRGEARWSLPIKVVAFILDFLAVIFLDKVILVGEHDWLSFKKFFPQKKIAMVRNGVKVGRTNQNRSHSGWVFLGRISPEKNLLNMIKAAHQLSEKLTIYGPISPPNLKYERAFLHELECSNAEWHGPVSSEQVRPILAKYRVFVNPSLTEGLPFAVLEAAAEGLYLVLSDIRPHRLLDFPACSFVDPDNLDINHLSGTTLNGEVNRAHVVNNFSVEKMLKCYLNIYRSLM